MAYQEGLRGPVERGELAGFAELVAETALSFLDESENGSARTLLEQIVAGAVLVIPGTTAAAVESIDPDGRLHAPVAEGDDVARSVSCDTASDNCRGGEVVPHRVDDQVGAAEVDVVETAVGENPDAAGTAPPSPVAAGPTSSPTSGRG